MKHDDGVLLSPTANFPLLSGLTEIDKCVILNVSTIKKNEFNQQLNQSINHTTYLILLFCYGDMLIVC